jgi:hypothetical protein
MTITHITPREMELMARVAELEKDAARLDWMESSETNHGFCHTQWGEYRYYAHQLEGYKTVRETIDAAMQSNAARPE